MPPHPLHAAFVFFVAYVADAPPSSAPALVPPFPSDDTAGEGIVMSGVTGAALLSTATLSSTCAFFVNETSPTVTAVSSSSPSLALRAHHLIGRLE